VPNVGDAYDNALAESFRDSYKGDGSLAAISPKPADGLTTKRASTIAVDFVVDRLTGSPNAPDARALTAQAAPQASRR
jgi:hypothetical protein